MLLSTSCLAKDRVVILDTGLNLEDTRFKSLLCEDVPGVDFTGEGIEDVHGHGTHVTGIIKQFAKDSAYCITIIKYYKRTTTEAEQRKTLFSAYKTISSLKPTWVNFSGGGPSWNDDEYTVIKNNPKTIFIVAVGNDNVNLDEKCNYYPACYKLPNIIRVGSLAKTGAVSDSTNFGTIVDTYEIGENVLSTLPDGRTGYMSGTSMSTATKTGKIIYEKSHPSCPFNSNSPGCDK